MLHFKLTLQPGHFAQQPRYNGSTTILFFSDDVELRKQHNTAIGELKVQEIIGYIATKYPDIFIRLVSQALADRADVRLKQVVELNSDKAMTIGELAFLSNMSVSTFKRHFAEVYNMSPQKYITRQRMEKAKSYLLMQKRPSDIYATRGYESLSSFSNEFRIYFGLSPKQFRSLHVLAAVVDYPEQGNMIREIESD